MLEAGRVEQNAAIALFKDAGALATESVDPMRLPAMRRIELISQCLP